MRETPRDAARLTIDEAHVPGGTGDRVHGYGVMGQPFASGDYLALRHWPASSFGPAYRSVWHRSPRGRWTIYADAAPGVSCARFVGSAADRVITTPIDLTWTADDELAVAVDDIRWTMTISTSPATAMLSRTGSALPDAAWRRRAVLTPMGPVAGAILFAGRLRMAGRTPNQQRYFMAPRKVWTVREASAQIGGRDAGAPSRVHPQAAIGRLWLPQRGVFFADTSATFVRGNRELVGPGERPRHRATTRRA